MSGEFATESDHGTESSSAPGTLDLTAITDSRADLQLNAGNDDSLLKMVVDAFLHAFGQATPEARRRVAAELNPAANSSGDDTDSLIAATLELELSPAPASSEPASMASGPALERSGESTWKVNDTPANPASERESANDRAESAVATPVEATGAEVDSGPGLPIAPELAAPAGGAAVAPSMGSVSPQEAASAFEDAVLSGDPDQAASILQHLDGPARARLANQIGLGADKGLQTFLDAFARTRKGGAVIRSLFVELGGELDVDDTGRVGTSTAADRADSTALLRLGNVLGRAHLVRDLPRLPSPGEQLDLAHQSTALASRSRMLGDTRWSWLGLAGEADAAAAVQKDLSRHYDTVHSTRSRQSEVVGVGPATTVWLTVEPSPTNISWWMASRFGPTYADDLSDEDLAAIASERGVAFEDVLPPEQVSFEVYDDYSETERSLIAPEETPEEWEIAKEVNQGAYFGSPEQQKLLEGIEELGGLRGKGGGQKRQSHRRPRRRRDRASPPESWTEWQVRPHRDQPDPRPQGHQAHHGVNSVWMDAIFPRYNPRAAPSMLMKNQPSHDATREVFVRIAKEIAQDQGVPFNEVDWSKVSPGKAWRLAEEQFEAAGTPEVDRAKYFEEFNRYVDEIR